MKLRRAKGSRARKQKQKRDARALHRRACALPECTRAAHAPGPHDHSEIHNQNLTVLTAHFRTISSPGDLRRQGWTAALTLVPSVLVEIPRWLSRTTDIPLSSFPHC